MNGFFVNVYSACCDTGRSIQWHLTTNVRLTAPSWPTIFTSCLPILKTSSSRFIVLKIPKDFAKTSKHKPLHMAINYSRHIMADWWLAMSRVRETWQRTFHHLSTSPYVRRRGLQRLSAQMFFSLNAQRLSKTNASETWKGERPIDRKSSYSGEVWILLVALCYRNQDKL